MKVRPLLTVLVLTLFVLAFVLWQHFHVAAIPLVLSFRIGQTFEEVVKNSSYPVVDRSNVPTYTHLQGGETFVTESAVVLVFNDTRHGFSLPPTKFALVGYTHNRVETVATSPMLKKLPFEQALVVLEKIQNQFKAGGWEPWRNNYSQWFDLTSNGKEQLYARMLEPGFSQEATLRVPNKYAMTLRLWCAEGCINHQPPYLFLIDIGVSGDSFAGNNFSLEAK